jgi:hypothetical protein
MENANATLQEGRNFGLLGQLGRNITDDMKVALTDARQTVRFLLNLCLGHHAEFQNFLREQPMYNVRTYDLVSSERVNEGKLKGIFMRRFVHTSQQQDYGLSLALTYLYRFSSLLLLPQLHLFLSVSEGGHVLGLTLLHGRLTALRQIHGG